MLKIVTKKRLKQISNFLVILFFVNAAYAAEEEGCSKNYSSLVLRENGDILFDTRAEKPTYPASLTKLMTLYLTFEALQKHKISPKQLLTISAYGEEISNINKYNTLHLKQGGKITIKEAIYSVIVKSYNEAAVTLAEAVAGNEWKFVRKMNEKAEELGMISSSFANSTGLHGEGQYTTAYDMARLSLALKEDFPEYYHLFSLKQFTYNNILYKTHNHVLAEYKGAEGMKTGFTNASGYNLISIARKGNERVISVLMSCESYKKRDDFTKRLFDKAFHKIADGNDSKLRMKLKKKFTYK
jgi:D-alanyl-D-alanine carboxypeptidase